MISTIGCTRTQCDIISPSFSAVYRERRERERRERRERGEKEEGEIAICVLPSLREGKREILLVTWVTTIIGCPLCTTRRALQSRH